MSGIVLPTQIKDRAISFESINANAGEGGDDTEIIREAYEWAAANNYLLATLGKKYLVTEPMKFHSNSFRMVGVVSGNRLDGNYLKGTVIESTAPSGVAFSFSGRQSKYSHMSFVSRADRAIESSLIQDSTLANIHLDVLRGDGVRIFDSFGVDYHNIDGWNRRKNRKGLGFWHDTRTPVAGGFNDYKNIWFSFFKNNIDFGQAEEFTGNPRRVHTGSGIQGRNGETGVRFGSGFAFMDVRTLWTENNTAADVQLHGATGPLTIHAINTGSIGPTKPIGVLLGSEDDDRPVGPLQVNMGRMRRSGGAIKVLAQIQHKHTFDRIEFRNSGPTLIGEGVDITRPL